jgi:hypothetical protein
MRRPQILQLGPFSHVPALETLAAVMAPAVKGPTLVVPAATVRPF